MKSKTDQAQLSSLHFSSGDDPIDFARKSVEDSRRFLMTHNTNLIERYEQGDAVLELKVTLRGADAAFCDYDFLFGSIPSNWQNGYVESSGGVVIDSDVFRSCDPDDAFYEECVLVQAGYLIQCPKKVIPSLVWLELSKQRDDFIGNMLAVSVNGVFKCAGAVPERELTLSPGLSSNGVGSMVQSLSKIVDGISSNLGDPVWQRSRELDLVKLFARNLRVEFCEHFVGVTFVEGFDSPFKILNVNLCSRKFTACASERVIHSQEHALPIARH